MNFYVHSTVRSPRKRTLRAAQPIHHRRTQFILDTQQRLIIGRPLTISEEVLERNMAHLIDLESKGIIEVKTQDGRYVHLKDKKIHPAPPVVPVFKERLDSAKEDPPKGKLPVFVPDTTEPLQPDTGAFSGGGMTTEAIAEAEKERTEVLATDEELAQLDAEAAGDMPQADDDDTDMANAFSDATSTPASTEETEHVEVTKKSKRRR